MLYKPISELSHTKSTEKSAGNQQLRKSLLAEQLEWLLKMGYTIDDIKEWTQTKLQPGRHEGFHDSGTISGCDGNLRELVSQATQTKQPSVSASSTPDPSSMNTAVPAKKCGEFSGFLLKLLFSLINPGREKKTPTCRTSPRKRKNAGQRKKPIAKQRQSKGKHL